MLSRVAENMLWMSRYVERAENTSRILDVNFRLLLDTGAADLAAAWAPLVKLVPQTWALFAERYATVTPDAVCQFMTFDSANPTWMSTQSPGCTLSPSSSRRPTFTLRRTPATSTRASRLASSTISITWPGIAKHIRTAS